MKRALLVLATLSLATSLLGCPPKQPPQPPAGQPPPPSAVCTQSDIRLCKP